MKSDCVELADGRRFCIGLLYELHLHTKVGVEARATYGRMRFLGILDSFLYFEDVTDGWSRRIFRAEEIVQAHLVESSTS
jgi:hypothetical protein